MLWFAPLLLSCVVDSSGVRRSVPVGSSWQSSAPSRRSIMPGARPTPNTLGRILRRRPPTSLPRRAVQIERAFGCFAQRNVSLGAHRHARWSGKRSLRARVPMSPVWERMGLLRSRRAPGSEDMWREVWETYMADNAQRSPSRTKGALQPLPISSALEQLRATTLLNSKDNKTGVRLDDQRVLLVSGSTLEQAWTLNVTRNQHLFTSLHDHLDYAYFNAEASASLLSDVGNYQPQWLKIRILRSLLHTDSTWRLTHPYILWVDDDIVMTNPNNFVSEMLHRLGPEEDMLLAKDAGDPSNKGVNTGMILLRSGARALNLIDAIWSMSTQRAPGGTLGTCGNQRCLHEQAAIDLLRKKDPAFRASVRVVEPVEDQFNMNTFFRRPHQDPARGMYLDYRADPDKYRWASERSTLNTCHVTGMVRSLRAGMLGECLDVAMKSFMSEVEHTNGGPMPLLSAYV